MTMLHYAFNVANESAQGSSVEAAALRSFVKMGEDVATDFLLSKLASRAMPVLNWLTFAGGVLKDIDAVGKLEREKHCCVYFLH